MKLSQTPRTEEPNQFLPVIVTILNPVNPVFSRQGQLILQLSAKLILLSCPLNTLLT